jgi:hypothetical protein
MGLNSFGLILGKCVWLPPSPKAALLMVAYFFGAVPGMPASVYETQIRAQYLAAGKTAAQADRAMSWLRGCVASYVVPAQNKGH